MPSLSLMTPVNVRALRPGDRLARAVFSRDGAKLLPRGTSLTPSLCSTLRAYEGNALFYAVVASRAGGETDRALVGEGIDQPLRRRLTSRGADALIAERAARWTDLSLRVERTPPALLPRDTRARTHGAEHAGRWPLGDALSRLQSERVEILRGAIDTLAEGAATDLDPFEAIADELLSLVTAHPERFTQLALMGERRVEYHAEHAFACAVLAVAVAARLGWAREDVRLAALAAMLADVGMATLPPEIRVADKRLDEVEINRVRRHPAMSAAMLASIGAVDERLIRAAYQHHEREDGRGYPARLRGDAISDLARVVAVADCFAAATANRPYKVFGKRPAHAMAEMVRLANAGVLHRPGVLALLEIAGMYPVGSWVALGTGQRAIVIGSNPQSIDRPIVQVAVGAGAGGGWEWGQVIDMADADPAALSVATPIDTPVPGAMRLAA